MKVFIDRDYNPGDLLEVCDPQSGICTKIQLPIHYDANTWIEVHMLYTINVLRM